MTDQLKHHVRKHLLVPLGRRLGHPQVQLSSPLIRGGNFLYYWMWADAHDHAGRPARVLYQDSITEWLDEFPLARHLTVRREELKGPLCDFIDRHRHTFGQDFDIPTLEGFSRKLVDTSPRFQERRRRLGKLVTPNSLVLNVRRGDYYQYDHLIEQYGLDIPAYVKNAISAVQQSGRPISSVLMVSDDPQWCMENLAEGLPWPTVVDQERSGMFDDLAALSLAPTLVLANSTFSYWGSHLAASFIPDHLAFAPPYHYREGGREVRDAFDPRWQIVSL